MWGSTSRLVPTSYFSSAGGASMAVSKQPFLSLSFVFNQGSSLVQLIPQAHPWEKPGQGRSQSFKPGGGTSDEGEGVAKSRPSREVRGMLPPPQGNLKYRR